MKIIIAGGTGFICTFLADYFVKSNNQVVILSRQQHLPKKNITYLQWDGKTLQDWALEIDGADVLINLAGKSVNCRYTEKNKREILDSRLHATRVLSEAVLKAQHPPKIWFNAASATIYRHAEDRPMDEFTGEIGSDFSMDVCKAWEKSFYDLTLPETRKVILRMSITMGINGGVYLRFKNLVRFGLGGKMGNGNQMMSWIHVEDIARAISFIIENEHINGIINVTSPHPVSNTDFMAAVRKAMYMPFGLPTPRWFLAFGAFVIGTETELILKSRWVIPQKLINAGYQFKYPQLLDLVNDVSGKPR